MQNSSLDFLKTIYEALFNSVMVDFIPVMTRNYPRNEGEEDEPYYSRMNDIFSEMGGEMAEKVKKLYPSMKPEEVMAQFREENPFSNLLEDDKDVFDSSVAEWIAEKMVQAEKKVAAEYAAQLQCDVEIFENIFHLISLQCEIEDLKKS